MAIGGAAAGGVALLAVLASIVGSSLRSPQQAAADAAPPSASLITVAAENRVLTQPIVLRGRVLAGAGQPITAPAAATGADSVVTAVPAKVGGRIREGGVLLVLAGRPLFNLKLPFPLYRDIAGGMTGPDVLEIQRALRRLGYSVPVTGVYDRTTINAVSRLYRDRGFTPLPGQPAAADGLPAARRAVERAESAYERARDGLAQARAGEEQALEPTEGPSEVQDQDDAAVAEAERAVAEAEAALEDARKALAKMELDAGAGLPQAAVIRLGDTGGTLTSVKVKVGDVVTDPAAVLFEVDGGDAYISAAAGRDQTGLLTVGLPASIVDEATGRAAAAEVEQVSSEPDAGGEGGSYSFAVRLRFTGEAMDPIDDRTVRVDLSAATGAEPVLAVPVTAVYSRADGSRFVTVLRVDHTTADVTVEPGQMAGGWVEVSADGLAPGDPVVVGYGGGA